MKKIVYLFALSILIFFNSCSEDDNSTSSSDYYLNLSVGNKDFNYDLSRDYELGAFSASGNSCDDEEIKVHQIGFVENENYEIFANFIFYKLFTEYENNSLETPYSGRLKDSAPLNTNIQGKCLLPNDISIDIYDMLNRNTLGLKENTSNEHKINRIDLISDSGDESLYAIEGDFSGTYYNDEDASDVDVSGNYRILIDLK